MNKLLIAFLGLAIWPALVVSQVKPGKAYVKLGRLEAEVFTGMSVPIGSYRGTDSKTSSKYVSGFAKTGYMSGLALSLKLTQKLDVVTRVQYGVNEVDRSRYLEHVDALYRPVSPTNEINYKLYELGSYRWSMLQLGIKYSISQGRVHYGGMLLAGLSRVEVPQVELRANEYFGQRGIGSYDADLYVSQSSSDKYGSSVSVGLFGSVRLWKRWQVGLRESLLFAQFKVDEPLYYDPALSGQNQEYIQQLITLNSAILLSYRF